ncbi:hypothetical protein [Salarchaeum sp. JOR-1]|nr:hypothetical protein [Salarchaeum sp. JOR-1]
MSRLLRSRPADSSMDETDILFVTLVGVALLMFVTGFVLVLN